MGSEMENGGRENHEKGSSNSCHRSQRRCGDNLPCALVDYHTLRVGGLVFAGIIVFLSVILLAGKSTPTLCVCVCFHMHFS